MKKLKLLLLVLLAAATLPRSADAQSAGVTPDDKTIQPFLANMGYEAQKVDESAYSISTKAGTCTVTVTVELSTNHQNL